MTTSDPFARPAGAARVASAALTAAAPSARGTSETAGSAGAPEAASADGSTVVAESTLGSPDAAAGAEASPAADEDGGGRAGRASRGPSMRPVTVPHQMPHQPSWPEQGTGEQTYVPDAEFDAEDLSSVNRELNRARARLFRVSLELKGAQREAVEAELTYRRHMRRALVSVSGGSAETRKAMAELACEEHENDLVVRQQVVEEWKKRSVDTRDDLKAIENLSHNIRAQLGIR